MPDADHDLVPPPLNNAAILCLELYGRVLLLYALFRCVFRLFLCDVAEMSNDQVYSTSAHL
jgi:hypothetical protein